MSTRINGVSASTYDNLLLDAGAVYLNFTDFSTRGTLMGATRGGSSFKIEQEVRDMPVDGALGPVKGSERIIKVMAQLTVNFIEHSLANFKRALPASVSATFDTSWDAVTRSVQIASTDYLDNVTFISQVSGKTGAVGFQLSNCLSNVAIEMALADKEEAALPITFTGHFLPTDLETEPWKIIYPNT